MAETSVTTGAEAPSGVGTNPAAVAARWISEIELSEKEQAPWRQRCKKIIDVYRREQKNVTEESVKRKFSLFWANIETLKPAVLAREPTAVVGRRYKDDDPVGRIASEVLERGLNFSIDAQDFADVINGVRDDFLLLGRGVPWIRYVPHMERSEAPDSDGQITSEPYEVVGWEEAIADHVSYDDFLHGTARKWKEVPWVGRRAFMNRDELVKRFPACGAEIPLDHEPSDYAGPDDEKERWKKAAVYEIWDLPSRKAIWISKGYTKSPLDERDDPLGLKDFFPCPRPALGTTGPNSLIPTPDYVYYQSQLADIDDLTGRIGKLEDALKMRGFYCAGDQTGKSLQDLLDTETGTLIPVDSWATFAEKGGVKGLVEWIPLDMVITTLKGCIEARKQLIDDVYQITGIADIMRGDTDPNETLGAQKLKANWGSSRVRDKQKELARVARDVLRLMGQVIATKFSPQTLGEMTNIQLLPDPGAKGQLQQQLQAAAMQSQIAGQHAQAMGQPPPPPFQPPAQAVAMLGKPTWQEVEGLLRNNTLRAFRIDVETDSTIEPNDAEEKQRRIEFIEAVGEYVSKSIPAIQLMPQIAPVIAQGLLFLVRGFRVGREMEDVIEKALEQLQQAGAGGQQQPKGPDPKVEQAKAQADGMSAQARVMDAQTNRMKAQADVQNTAASIQAENARTAADRQADLHMHGADLAADMHQAVLHAVERREVHDINSQRPMTAPTQ